MDVLPVIKPNFDIAAHLPPYSATKETLREAVGQLDHPNKDERILAAQAIHQAAAIYPHDVAPLLPRLLPALETPETQTRWMILRAIGLCATLEPQTAINALPHARNFLQTECGTTLWNATLVYLGNVGATCAENASQVLPLLEKALIDLPQLTKAILECLVRLLDAADIPTLLRIAKLTAPYTKHNKAGIRASANKIVKRVSEYGLLSPEPVASLSFDQRVQMGAQPQRVYDAFTHADEINRWFTSMSFVDARPGGSIQLRWQAQGSSQPMREDDGRVLQAIRPERFVFTWHPHWSATTTVEINLQPNEDGTLLHLHESGYEDSPTGSQALAEISARWMEALAQLKTYVENTV